MFEFIVRTKILIKLLRNQTSDRIRGLLYQGGSLGPWVQFAKNISYQLDWLFFIQRFLDIYTILGFSEESVLTLESV